MKEVNWYTGSLFTVGVISLFQLSYLNIERILPFLLIMGLIVALDMFRIKLPSGDEFAIGSIGSLLILFEFGFTACLLSFMISLFFMSLKTYRSLHRINWFRYFSTLGMLYISLLLAFAVMKITEDMNVLFRVFLVAAVYETANYLLFLGIKRTISRTPLFQNIRTTLSTMSIIILSYVVVLPRFFVIDESDWALLLNELVYAAFFLLIIIFFSRQYGRDIQIRKQTETELRISEAKYRHIAENTSDLIWLVDVNGFVQYASPSSKHVLGLEPEVLEGQFLLKRVHPDNVPALRKIFLDAIQKKTPILAEFGYQHADGDWLHMEAHGKPVIGENGEVESIVVVARDITKRKKTEELLRRSDKLSAVGQLAAGVAHEIRNPLTSIKGFIHLIKSGTHKVEYYDIVLSEIDRMESIIHEFLMLAKPQATNFKETDPRVLVKNVITLLTTQAIFNNVQIQYDFDPDVPPIMCDQNQIKQVFINLIQNAIEAMPDGGNVMIYVKRQDENYVLIRVEDQGYGISEDRIPRLGEPFYSTKEKGTGLGLMVSYKIIQEHQGSIAIQSKVNQGTTVNVTLPIRRADAEDPAHNPPERLDIQEASK